VPPVSKVELYAAIRRDSRAGVSSREIERMHGVGRRTVVAAVGVGVAAAQGAVAAAGVQARCGSSR